VFNSEVQQILEAIFSSRIQEQKLEKVNKNCQPTSKKRTLEGLQIEDTQQLIISCIDLMMRTTMKLLSKKNDMKPQMAIHDAVQDGEDGNSDDDDQLKTL
jgi:hypothetical protein